MTPRAFAAAGDIEDGVYQGTFLTEQSEGTWEALVVELELRQQP